MSNYVETGLMQVVFVPVLNHGNPSVAASVSADCYEEQDQLWSATRDYYVNTAVAIGADRATFEQCYDDGSGLARVQALDALRRERGITSQPVFDVNGVITAGLGNLFPTINGVIDQLEQ